MFRRIILTLLLVCSLGAQAEKKTLTVAAYPAVDAIVKAALPAWQQKIQTSKSKLLGANTPITTRP